MKSLFKKSFSILTAAALTISCLTAVPAVSFADTQTQSERDIECSHIEFISGYDDEGNDTVKARAFIRDYSGNNGKVSLFCASYDESGNLVGAAVKSGMNTVLSTDGYNTPENTAKTVAYVWDQTTLAPITDTATRGASVIPTITLDGKSFKDYMGADFDKNTKEYTKALKYTYNPFIGKNELEWPKVRAELSDMSGSCRVINDSDAMTTTVRVFSGDRIASSETLNGGESSAERFTYTKPHTDYVIKWTVPDGIFVGNSLVQVNHSEKDKQPYNPIAREDYFTYKNVTTVEKGEVKFNVTGFSKPNGILIVKPVDLSVGKDIIVADTDGTPLKWKNNWWFAGRDDYDESTQASTGAEISESTPVTLTKTDDTSKTFNTYVYRKTTQSDDGYKTGGSVATDRSPLTGKGIARLAPDLQGYNYIPVSSDTQNSTVGSNFEIKFYVNAPAELIWLSANDIGLDTYTWTKTTADTVTDTDKLAERCRVISSYSWKNCFAMIRYINTLSAHTVAKAIMELGLPKNQFVRGGNRGYTLNDGTTVTAEEYRTQRYCDLYAILDKYGKYALLPASSQSPAAKYTTLDTILTAMASVVGAANEIGDALSDLDLKADYDGLAVSVKEFPIMNAGMFSDRDPFSAGNTTKTGALLSYPDALELDGVKFVYPCIDWQNGQSQMSADYIGKAKGSITPNPDFDGKWFNFTAKDDCEVIILTTGIYPKAADDGWITATAYGDDDTIKIAENLNGKNPTFFKPTNIYTKKFAAGDKVQIYNQGNHKFVFVRRTPKAVTASGSGSEEDTRIGAANVEVTAPVYDAADTTNKVQLAKRDSEGNIVTAVNTFHTEIANVIGKLTLNSGGTGWVDGVASAYKLGSKFFYDRSIPNNDKQKDYTNDVRTIRDDYKFLVGSDYIMTCAGESTQRAANGYETSFTLYKDATVVLFAKNINSAQAAAKGWTVKTDTSNPFMTIRVNNTLNMTAMAYKHFAVSDKESGIKVTFPRQLLFADGKESIDKTLNDDGKANALAANTYESIGVIYYD